MTIPSGVCTDLSSLTIQLAGYRRTSGLLAVSIHQTISRITRSPQHQTYLMMGRGLAEPEKEIHFMSAVA